MLFTFSVSIPHRTLFLCKLNLSVDTILMRKSFVLSSVYHKVHYALITLLKLICIALGLVYCSGHHFFDGSFTIEYRLINSTHHIVESHCQCITWYTNVCAILNGVVSSLSEATWAY